MSEMPIFETMALEEAPTIDEIMAEELVAANPRRPVPWAIYWPGSGSTLRKKHSQGVEVRVKISRMIGMLQIDRAWRVTCEWKSPFCTKHCYNHTGHQPPASKLVTGKKDEAFWKLLDGAWLHEFLHSDYFAAFCERLGKTPVFMRSRMRIASKGEAFKTPQDVLKVEDLCVQNPATTFWIPTRAWSDAKMADLIDQHVRSLANARVLASTDPSYTAAQFEALRQLGWNTMFFGDNALDLGMFMCPKTWEPIHSYCRVCKDGCFKRGRVDVHLKTHSTSMKKGELERDYDWIPGVGPGR